MCARAWSCSAYHVPSCDFSSFTSLSLSRRVHKTSSPLGMGGRDGGSRLLPRAPTLHLAKAITRPPAHHPRALQLPDVAIPGAPTAHVKGSRLSPERYASPYRRDNLAW